MVYRDKEKLVSLKQDLEHDIAQFLREMEKMLPEDQKKHLFMLVEKYCHITTSTMLLDKYDLDMIKSAAHSIWLDKPARAYLGKNRREVTSGDINVLRIVEGTIAHLNSKDCLKKLPKFDYKE